MKNNTIAKVGLVGLLVLTISECGMINAPAVLAEESLETQTLSVEPHLGFLSRLAMSKDFNRMDATIDENVNPWLDPEEKAKQLSTEELKSILISAGFEGYSLRMAQAIVALESTRRPLAHNPNASTGDNSYGLFQINMFRGLEAQRLKQYDLERNEDLFDPIVNSEIAYKISGGGVNWGAWTTYPDAKKIVGQFSN